MVPSVDCGTHPERKPLRIPHTFLAKWGGGGICVQMHAQKGACSEGCFVLNLLRFKFQLFDKHQSLVSILIYFTIQEKHTKM